MANRENILAGLKLKREAVEWAGDALYVREMDGTQRFEWAKEWGGAAGDPAAMAELSARAAVRYVEGEDGKPVFTDTDIAAIREGSGAFLNAITDAFMSVNGLLSKSVADAKKN